MALNNNQLYYLRRKLLYVLIGAVLMFVVQEYRHTTNTTYTKELEKLLALCLSDSTGKPIRIGDELYLCGIYKLGEKVGH